MNSTTETIDLGNTADVKVLFSFPPNCHEICFLKQTLEQTIARYLTSSIKRDLFNDSSVSVRSQNEHVIVEIEGSAGKNYSALLRPFLKAGLTAFNGSLRLNADKKWRYNWRFFLPLGLAMSRHRTVQLLHFPPDYVLARDQDYLSAHTTLRWAELLCENGVKQEETALFQNIVDIAPIAAPSNDGKNLEGVYAYYDDYILALLHLWLPSDKGQTRPMVAFGGPVRDWLKIKFGLDLKVLSFTLLKVNADLQVPTLAANHPSFIYNAVDRLKTDNSTSDDEKIAILMRIMQQDLIAANWQTLMGKDPTADPQATLASCQKNWSSPSKRGRICQLTYIQVFNKTPEEAAKLCAKLPKPADFLLDAAEREEVQNLEQHIDRLRSDLGPLEGREPEDIVT